MSARLPKVSTVIATKGRPELLRRAVRSVLAQQYEGDLEVIVVYDYIDIDPLADVEVPRGRELRLMRNERAAGLAGGRNTGIEVASGQYVAFCDDDDYWLPAKLGVQVLAWQRDPDAIGVATGIEIRTPKGPKTRTPAEVVTFEDFLDSRVTEIHPSSFLWRRADLLGRVGLVDEGIPSSYGEDYDLLLRATKFGHIRATPSALVIVDWERTSFFTGRWEAMVGGLTYLLQKHTEFSQTPKGTARIAGQVSFAHAALGRRDEAWRWAHATLRRDKRQLRAYAALLVALGLLSPAMMVAAVNSTGRGL